MPADRKFTEAQLEDAVSGATSPLAGIAGIMQHEAPSTAADFKKRRTLGFTVELPSGMKVHVRRTFDMLANLKGGKIPNPLAGLVEEMIENKRPSLDVNTMGAEAVQQMLAMFDQTLEAMMIAPRFQARPADAPWDWEPEEDAIGPFDMGLEDKVFLFQLSQGGTADLATFRQQSNDIVATLSDGSEVRGEAE